MIFIIQKATITDFPDILKIKKEKELKSKTLRELKEEVGEKLKRDDGIILLTKINNEIIAYISGYEKNKIAYIETIYVKEEYENSKIEEKLINEFRKWTYEKNIKTIEIILKKEEKNKDFFYNEKGFAKLKEEIDEKGNKISIKKLTIN